MKQFQPQPVIQHFDESYIQFNLDFMLICNYSQPKAAILWMLEEAQEEWIPITLDNFGPVAPLIGLDSPTVLTQVLEELVDTRYIEQCPDGTPTYQVNVPAVQSALDALDWIAIKQQYPDLETE